jgi:hypothetical protein
MAWYKKDSVMAILSKLRLKVMRTIQLRTSSVEKFPVVICLVLTLPVKSMASIAILEKAPQFRMSSILAKI